jgi:hypothetical protein
LKPKLIALNLLLVAIVGVTIWQGTVRWQETQQLRRATLNVRVKPVPPPPMSPAPQPQTPPATKYEDIANKNLFSSDRNDQIVIDVPPVEKPKPMPPFPIATGVMKLPSGVKAFMAEKPGDPVHAVKLDDMIGEFKITALDTKNVTFDWNGKKFDKTIDELIDRSNHQVTASAAAPAAATNTAPPPAAPALPPGTNPIGTPLTDTTKACRPGDTSPAGTVEDGFKKTVTPSIFGPVCRWVKQ